MKRRPVVMLGTRDDRIRAKYKAGWPVKVLAKAYGRRVVESALRAKGAA